MPLLPIAEQTAGRARSLQQLIWRINVGLFKRAVNHQQGEHGQLAPVTVRTAHKRGHS
jgi:hypothetical protein